MNPSANGWIKKLLKDVSLNNELFKLDDDSFYEALRSTGFIYGNTVSIINNCVENEDLTTEEMSKVNLYLSLLYTHINSNVPTNDFINSVIKFYSIVSNHKKSIFDRFFRRKKSSGLVEKIIHKRILLDDNIITKNFNYFITNALLYVDVLAYKTFLDTNEVSKTYIENLESDIISVVIKALGIKTKKTLYDDSLISLLESSLRYQNIEETSCKRVNLVLNNLESQYVIDLACMGTWSDKVIDSNEHVFLKKLTNDLNINEDKLESSMSSISSFYEAHKKNIPLLGSKNIVKTFYNNSSKMVTKLIFRNSKRLVKELRESKELMILLSQSTSRKLTVEEQKKIQEQLLDIFKSIPSLAIFILPGGALLLPLFIKIVPKLLPSAFDDNRIEED